MREVAKLVGLDRDETGHGALSRFLYGGVLSQPFAVPKWERITHLRIVVFFLRFE